MYVARTSHLCLPLVHCMGHENSLECGGVLHQNEGPQAGGWLCFEETPMVSLRCRPVVLTSAWLPPSREGLFTHFNTQQATSHLFLPLVHRVGHENSLECRKVLHQNEGLQAGEWLCFEETAMVSFEMPASGKSMVLEDMRVELQKSSLLPLSRRTRAFG